MPAQDARSDDEVDAVIAYIQSGFCETPAGAVVQFPTRPTRFHQHAPGRRGAGLACGVLIAVGVAGLVLWSGIAVPIDRLTVAYPRRG
ncbi:MAG: hypothetical protein R2746_10365 [Acidimicrobiales bacterium]